MLLVHPVPQCHDDIALDPLRPLRLSVRQFASSHAVSPIRQILDRKGTHPGQLAHHKLRRLSRLHSAYPSLFGRGEVPKAGLNCSRRELAQLMAAYAAVVFHLVEPLGLRHLAGDAGLLAPELICRRNFQHRVPVNRRIVPRCRGLVGSQRRGEVQFPAWFGHHFRTIY